MVKPVPGVGNYPPRLGRAHFPPAKGYARGGDGVPSLPSQECPQKPGVVNQEATNHCAHPGSLLPREAAGTQGKEGPHSPSALSQSERIKSGPLSLSGLEKRRKVPWIWKHNGSERITRD